MEEKHMRIWRYLQNCKGRDKALTSKQLSRLTGMSEREVRAVIAELRRDNYPIASAVHPPYGFFLPEGIDEARECQAHLYSRMRELGITARALDRAFGEHLPGRQMILDLFGKGESA
ncbi:MAG TPA: hypothetical protein GXX51_00530 [Firmicutes bacterium]|nr:hypothetical protein [Bacillota bacterium]